MSRPPQTLKRRAGFTLVELLVVILILAILIALLVPAIAGAVRSANDARVTAEITNLQTALADFRSKYGEYPPSRIILHNNGFYNTSDSTGLNGTNDVTVGEINLRTVRAMRKYFPRAGAYFNTSGVGSTFTSWDGVSAANSNTSIILQGHECLVFFLGGMPEATIGANSTTYAMTGFARDPQNPFNRSGTAPNRSAPLFEFAPGRLQDVFSLGGGHVSGPPNGFPSYVDPLNNSGQPRPYAYFSSYGNNAYDPNDDNSAELGNSGDTSTIEYDDGAPPSLVGRSFLSGNNAFLSGAPNPYTNGNPITPIVNGSHGPVSWVNPQTFQLISSGRDGQWGYGGSYDATSSQRLPVYSTESLMPSVRQRENDNITNFTGGKMQ